MSAVGTWLRTLLDVLIAAYAAVLVLTLVTGGIDIGFVSLTGAAKPILVLLLLVPLRLTFRGPSRVLPGSFGPPQRWASVLRDWRHDSPAAVDVASSLIPISATFFVAFLADLLFAPYRARAFAMPFEWEKLAQIFAGWDSGWYFDIARRGYYFNPEGQSSIAFFPLYPMAVRAVAWPFGVTDRTVWLAAIAVSCGAFVLALLAVHRFTHRMFGDREVARRAVLYLALFPFSLFFTRVYAESLFLLTSVLAVSRAYDGRWWSAGVWGALAALTRPNGILIGLPLALLALRGRPGLAMLASRLGPLLLVPLGLAGYCAYVYTLSGDPLAWLSAQGHWGYSLGHPPWEQLLRLIGRLVKYGFYDYFFLSAMAPFRLLHGAAGLFCLSLAPAVFKRFGAPLGAYVLVSVLVPLSGNALEGVGRYCAVLFPLFMVMATVQSRRVHDAIVIVFALLLALVACLFATGRPVY